MGKFRGRLAARIRLVLRHRLWFPSLCATVSIIGGDSCYQHSTLHLRNVLMAVLACALAGCWEEIHYSPPPATSAAAQPSPPEAEAPTSNFADEVATSLTSEEESEPTPP